MADLTLAVVSTQPDNRTAVSGEDGRFVFEGIAPGTYRLRVYRAGFVQQAYTSGPTGSPAIQIRLSAGEAVSNIVFRLIPQGVIAGKVVDTRGSPVAGARVRVIPAPGSRLLYPGGTAGAMTNDLGEYRLPEISPGRYLVIAAPPPRRPRSSSAAGVGSPEEALLDTYYPATADQKSATALEVGPGREVAGVMIQLRSGRVYRIQGAVVGWSPGEGLPRVRVLMRPRPAGGVAATMSMTGPGETPRSDGSFELSNVAPGEYHLMAIGLEQRPRVVAWVPVKVVDSDLRDVALRIRKPVSVQGVIRMEGQEQASLPNSRIFLTPREGPPLNPPSADITGDLRFTLEGVTPDIYVVTVGPMPAGAYVRSIRIGDLESRGSVLDLTEAPADAAVEILVSRKAATR